MPQNKSFTFIFILLALISFLPEHRRMGNIAPRMESFVRNKRKFVILVAREAPTHTVDTSQRQSISLFYIVGKPIGERLAALVAAMVMFPLPGFPPAQG
jgi:hypothetical protein